MNTAKSRWILPSRLFGAIGTVWQVLGVTFLLLVLVEVCFAGVRRLKAEPIPRVRMLDALLAAQHNPAGLREEHEAQESSHLVLEEFAYWRRAAQHGPTLNVDERGLRRTYNAGADAKDAIEIFTFGGSTMWGWNSRDDFTIASQLSKLANERGYNVHVTNYAQTGYISTQESIALARAVGDGERPDIVVALNGLNDVEAAFFNARAGLTYWYESRQWWFPRMFLGMSTSDALRTVWQNSATCQVLNHVDYPEPDIDAQRVPSLAREIAGHYAASAATFNGLADSFGFHARLYLQPILFTKKRLTVEERSLIPLASGHMLQAGNRLLFSAAYEQIVSTMNASPRFKQMQDLFADTDELVYTDGQHYSEEANRVIAQAILEDLREPLERLSRISVMAREQK
jgi:lysophospholipase L1-like esterase